MLSEAARVALVKVTGQVGDKVAGDFATLVELEEAGCTGAFDRLTPKGAAKRAEIIADRWTK